LYTLTNGIFSHENSDTITVNFTAADLNSVKTEAGLCEQSQFQCWIRFGSTLVSDLAGNAIIPIADADISSANCALETRSVRVRDTTSPQLTLTLISYLAAFHSLLMKLWMLILLD